MFDLSPEPGAAADVGLVTDAETATSLTAEWEELADHAGAGPFSRPGYGLTWWRCLGRGRLLVVTVRQSGTLVALAPWHERRYGPVRVVRWLGHGLGTVGEILVRPGHEEQAGHVWRAAHDGRRVLQLTEYRSGGAGLLSLRRDPRWRTGMVVHDRCPVIDLNGRSADAHLAQSGRRNIRRTVRSAQRHLVEAGASHQVEVVCQPVRLDAVLPELTATYDVAEDARPRLHLLRSPWRDFTVSFLRDAVSRGQAVVFVGRIDNRPVSVDLVLLTGTTMATWAGRFDPSARRFTPGHLAQYAMIDWAAASGHQRIDLLLGDPLYKRQWATGGYDTLAVIAEPAGLPGVGRAVVHAIDAGHTAKRRAQEVFGGAVHRR